MRPQQSQPPKNLSHEDVVRTQEMSLEELELAMQVVKLAEEKTSVLEFLPIPNSLKHLSPLDWEVVGNLLMSLEYEQAWSQVH